MMCPIDRSPLSAWNISRPTTTPRRPAQRWNAGPPPLPPVKTWFSISPSVSELATQRLHTGAKASIQLPDRARSPVMTAPAGHANSNELPPGPPKVPVRETVCAEATLQLMASTTNVAAVPGSHISHPLFAQVRVIPLNHGDTTFSSLQQGRAWPVTGRTWGVGSKRITEAPLGCARDVHDGAEGRELARIGDLFRRPEPTGVHAMSRAVGYSQSRRGQNAREALMNYGLVEGWEQLPTGYEHRDVAGVAVDREDR